MAKKILVMGEGVTLAHVGRPWVIATALKEAGYDVTFACDRRFLKFVDTHAMRVISITSINSTQFLERVTWGKPLFTSNELKAGVEEDLGILDAEKPDVVIGDLRWSLSVSARLRQIPYAGISNAYWSPYSARQRYILPSHPILQRLGFKTMQALFTMSKPVVFPMMTLPNNRIRKHYGLPALGLDYRSLHEDADHIFYADMEELHPLKRALPTRHYIGPIQWSLPIALPAWWSELREDKPTIYVNLGSSGDASLLPTILSTLAALPVQVIAATAGRVKLESPGSNVFLSDYLPGEICAQRANIAITNGGSPSVYQALINETPVIGIVGLVDQALNMHAIEAVGAGEMLCASLVTAKGVRETVERMLQTPSYNIHAADLAHAAAQYNIANRLQMALIGLVK